MENKYGIYTITNTVTGKTYIGQTITSFKRRWGAGYRTPLKGGYHKLKELQSDWDRYGAESFLFEPLEIGHPGLSKEERLAWCNEREKYWIADSWKSDETYNTEPGGGSSIPNERTRKRMSESKSGENHPNWGKPAWNRGKSPSEETRRRQSEAHLGQTPANIVGVIWTDQNGVKHEFESRAEAAQKLNTTSNTIFRAIKRGGWSHNHQIPEHLRGTTIVSQ